MEKDGYRWWMKRFQKMAEYFDAYRIDHILGFFRIWEIPMHAVHGLLGQFVPSIPMSKEEIESYGLPFREEYLMPYIHESFLGQIFGPHTDYVKQTFLSPSETSGVYHMKPEFETQRKVESFFAGKNDENSIWIRDGLYTLISDVLFVPDTKEKINIIPASEYNATLFSVHLVSRNRMRLTSYTISIITIATMSSGASRL